jgi:hypothetical protein
MRARALRRSTFLLAVLAIATLATVSCHRNLNEGIVHKDDYMQAYIYAYPMLANYKAMYDLSIDKSSPQYKGPFNTVVSDSHAFTAKDTNVITPNLDTPYSVLQADLRAEPVVFCIPDVPKERYYSVQLIDMYTFNYGYVGTRTTGSLAGCYLIAGPGWHGATPPGILRAFQCDTQFSLLIYRTQLFGPNDIANVKKIQQGYTVQTLSAYTHQPAPPAPPPVEFPKFTEEAFKTDYIKFLNFLLQFCPEVAEEAALRLRFATIGIGPGKPYDFATLRPNQQAEIEAAIKEAYASIQERRDQIGKNINGWRVGAPYGSRDYYHGDNLKRSMAVMAAIYGNDPEEVMVPATKADIIGAPLDSGKHNYTITFAGRNMPPVNAFWSVTVYDGKTQLLVDNPINRYVISTPVLSSLKKNPDGGVTLYLQKDDPGPDKKANWLPAPNGPLYVMMRLYWPRKSPPPSILPPMEGTWDPPGVLLAR